MDEEDFSKLVVFAENTLLMEADVIFSTLSTCHSILGYDFLFSNIIIYYFF